MTLQDNSYAILKEDYPVWNREREKTIMEKGSPVFIEYYNELIGGYLGIVKVGDKILKVPDLWDRDLEPVKQEGLDSDVSELFEELSRHKGE